MHPTSLPSRGGIGDLGPAAYEFVDWLSAARQTLWQILPLGPVGFGNSPYSSISAFAGNPLLVSLERLADHGYLDPARYRPLPDGGRRWILKTSAHTNFRCCAKRPATSCNRARRGAAALRSISARDNAWWLEDYVLFSVLRDRFGDQSWNPWPHELARRTPAALSQLRADCTSSWRWSASCSSLSSSNGRRCALLPPSAASASSATSPSSSATTAPMFGRIPTSFACKHGPLAGSRGRRSAGCLQRDRPALGQSPLRWDAEVARIRLVGRAHALGGGTCDIVRLDHFRGFEAYWEIPADEPTAINGRWVRGPNDDLFTALRNALGELPFIAEDLGFITPEVTPCARGSTSPA